tara:strand:+ start:19 stop:498 length:480 start_codon:yes stop_codon:yes gene_type:complete
MISVQFNGDKKVIKSIENLGSRSHRRELFDQIGSYGVSSTQQRFLDQTGPDGQKWKPSARARENGGQTLRDRNHLFQSLTHDYSADHAEWGTNIIYAAIHQFGGIIKAKSANALQFFVGNRFATVKQVVMPARPFLGIDSKDEAEIAAIVDDWVRETVQ